MDDFNVSDVISTTEFDGRFYSFDIMDESGGEGSDGIMSSDELARLDEFEKSVEDGNPNLALLNEFAIDITSELEDELVDEGLNEASFWEESLISLEESFQTAEEANIDLNTPEGQAEYEIYQTNYFKSMELHKNALTMFRGDTAEWARLYSTLIDKFEF